MDVVDKIRDSQKELLRHLVAYETAVAELYGDYSATFACSSDFWRTISREEASHAAQLKALGALLDTGHCFYGLERFDAQAMEACHAVIRRAQRALKAGGVSIFEALESALEIESFILDGAFFEDAKSSYPAFALIAAQLVKEEQRHVAQIRKHYLDLQAGKPVAERNA